MRTRSGPAGLSLGAALLLCASPALAEDKVEAKVVKYADLARTVNQLKGKVVVVDFWSIT